jgi:putative spermidine/putrescine transport system substrate-binding protein
MAGVLAACRGREAGVRASPPASVTAVDFDALVARAKEEGTLNTIALPPDFANYGQIMQTFEGKYSVDVVNRSPNASSAEELGAVRALEGLDRAPDVLDVGPPFALQAVEEGLVASYKVATWDTIPDELKDPDGYWVGDYWGVIAFGANTDVTTTPTSWQDLLDPTYKGQVALNGDPRESGAAFAGVFAASLANGGSLDNITPGVDFFAELKRVGNFIPVEATPGSILQGETPITIDWDYGQLAYSDEFAGQITWEVSVPRDGVFGNYYCQAINKEAPHPFAARLWQEFLYSDEGQLLWLAGYSHPARFQDMADRGVIPQELLAKLPPAEAYETVQFPNAEQSEAATAILQEQWGEKVAGL